MFGASETDVDFTPDLLENLTIRVGNRTIGGRFFKQVYRPGAGKAIGAYMGGAIAAIENQFGKGRAILIVTFPGAAYFKKPNAEARAWFAGLLPAKQRIAVNDTAVTARLHDGRGGAVLWIVNPTREAKTIVATVEGGAWKSGEDVWSAAPVQSAAGVVRVRISARDAAVIRLR